MINATWHRAHPMPKQPTPVQRLAWHLAHQRACRCRELTKAQLKKLIAAAASSVKRKRPRATRAR